MLMLQLEWEFDAAYAISRLIENGVNSPQLMQALVSSSINKKTLAWWEA